MEAVVRVGMLEVRRLVTAMVAVATVAACSGGDDNGTEPTPTIDIVVAPTTATVAQGGNTTVTLTLTRSGGFTGDVALAFEGVPTGVTPTAAPSPLGSAATTSVITFAASGTAATGAATVTVRATGTGVTAKTATVALTVNAAPTYTLTAAAATVAAGGTGTSNITITRAGGFAGAVTLAATGLPTGVTAAFNPNNTTTNASVLTFTAAGNAAAGTSTVTVTGTATGQTDKTATLQLTVTAAPAGTYTVAVTPATQTIQQGTTVNETIALTRTGGFAGAVTLAVEGLPTGVTGAFAPNGITGDASTLTLTAAAGATVGGPTTVTVRGTATGQTDKTATFQLSVTAAPAGGFTLALAAPTLTVQQSATNNATVNITRTNGFAGTVNLTATGLPTGVTAAFNPAAATGNTSTLTLTASGTATVGPATVTVRGNATGLTEQTATLTLTVTAATGGSGNTTWEFCTAAETPLWMAIQDGASGTWTRVTPTGTRFQFNITQARGGVAFVTGESSGSIATVGGALATRLSTMLQQEMLLRNRVTRTAAGAYASAAVDGFQLAIFYGTQQELNASGTSRCLPGTGKTVSGTVAGLGQFQSALISLGPSSGSASSATPGYQLTNVPDGALDLIASRLSINITTFEFTVDKLIMRRAQNFANNATIPVLDFGAAEAFDPVQPNMTINNLGTDVAFVATSFFTAAGGSSAGASLFATGLPSSGPFKYYGVPSNKLINGDLHLAFAIAMTGQTSTDQFRYAGLYFKEPTDRAVTLGPALTAPTVSTAATAPYVRFRATAAIQTNYNKNVSATFTQSNTSTYRTVSITATEGYLAGMANYDFTIPDFTGVAGWDNNWGPKTGVLTNWTIVGTGYTGVGFGSSTPLEGATFSAGARSGEITP
jgi:hypothetical protein